MRSNSAVASRRNTAGSEERIGILMPVAAYCSSGMPNRNCKCGHDRPAHEHYRRGADCGLCECNRYRRERPAGGLLQQWIAKLQRGGKPGQ
jgi:hypothetical protein